MAKNIPDDLPPPYSTTDNNPVVHGLYPPNAPSPYNAPPPGYQPYQNTAPAPVGFLPSYGTTQPTMTNIIINPPIINVGACPACRIGVLEDDFTCLGILCAIAFFPLGILCCLAMKNRRCSNCGAYFG